MIDHNPNLAELWYVKFINIHGGSINTYFIHHHFYALYNGN